MTNSGTNRLAPVLALLLASASAWAGSVTRDIRVNNTGSAGDAVVTSQRGGGSETDIWNSASNLDPGYSLVGSLTGYTFSSSVGPPDQMPFTLRLYLRESGGTKGTLLQSLVVTRGELEAGYPGTYWDLAGDLSGATVTYYTNSVGFHNDTMGPLGVEVVYDDWNGDGPRSYFGQVAGGETFTATIVGTNGYPVVELTPFPWGGSTLETPYPTISGTNIIGTASYSPPPPNASSNILWSGTSGAAQDSTLKEGFQTLFNAITELGARQESRDVQGGGSGFSYFQTNAITVSGLSNVATETTLSAISNMMAQSDSHQFFTNQLGWLNGNADSIWAKAQEDTEEIGTALGEVTGVFNGAFQTYGTPAVPNMVLQNTSPFWAFTVDLDPLHNPTLAAFASAFKQALKWLAVLIFCGWAIGLLFRKIDLVANAHGTQGPQFTKGFNSWGGLYALFSNLGWSMSILYLTVWLAVILAMVGLVATFADDFQSYLTELAVPWLTAGGWTAIGLYLFDAFVPWVLFMQLGAAAVAWFVTVHITHFAAMFAMRLLIRG